MKNYYKILKVNSNATQDEIRKSYYLLAKIYHPDVSNSINANFYFQEISEAYTVLSSPEKKKAYDQASLNERGRNSDSNQDSSISPVCCHVCGDAATRPQFIVIYTFTSFLLSYSYLAKRGAYCFKCAEGELLSSTTRSFVNLGIGFFFIPFIFALNLFGGYKPNRPNAVLLFQQALFFLSQKKMDFAKSLAEESLRLAKKIKKHDFVGSVDNEEVKRSLISNAQELLAKIETIYQEPTSKVGSSFLKRKSFYFALASLSSWMFASLFLYQFNYSEKQNETATRSNYAKNLDSEPAYAKPKYAQNGELFPEQAGYVNGYKRLNRKGLSKITIDNGDNSSDVFVKVYSLDSDKMIAAFYIPGFDKFTVDKVAPGNYDVRYLDLTYGGFAKTDSFALEEIATSEGIKYQNMTMTLYKIRNGNMQTHKIDADDFGN